MKFEKQIVDYILNTKFEDIPRGAIDTTKRMLLADIGTAIAGVQADGCQELADFYSSEGGTPEATMFAVLSAPIDQHGLAFREAAAKIASVDTLRTFMTDFTKKFAPAKGS